MSSAISQNDSAVRFHQMLDAAREAVALAKGKQRRDLDTKPPINLGLVRLLEVVSEAASRTPPDERAQYPQLPWAQVVGLRNRLIRNNSVDRDLLWQIVTCDLPPLVRELEQIISSDWD